MLTPSKKKFIEFMMSADVLRFGQFVTKSGRHTPYFVNTGNYKTGLQSSMLGSFYAELIHETVGDAFDAMFGPAYKGIPLVTACSGALAREYGIPAVLDVYPHYSSDVAVAWKAGLDAPAALIGPGVQASHGMERTHLEAMLGTLELTARYLDCRGE